MIIARSSPWTGRNGWLFSEDWAEWIQYPNTSKYKCSLLQIIPPWILQHILPVMTDILGIPMIPEPSDIALGWTWHDFTIDE